MARKKKIFTQSQITKKLGLQSYIVLSWEKQFGITPTLKNGDPIYTRHDLAKLRSIKELLYEKGFSIDAAKKYIQDKETIEGATLIAASPLLFESQHTTAEKTSHSEQRPTEQSADQALMSKLITIRKQLIKISNSL